MSSTPTKHWKEPGSPLLKGVTWYVEYKRRYQQVVHLYHDGTICSRNRWYYLWPRWLRPGGCKCACYPKNVESYYKDSEWENEDWSSSDEEGTIAAYTLENEHLFFAYSKTGEKLKPGETVLPYVGPLKIDQTNDYDPFITGRVFVSRDKIMEKSYDPERDPYDWYMLPVDTAIRKRERHLERSNRKMNGGK
jgi:hypothetical protein